MSALVTNALPSSTSEASAVNVPQHRERMHIDTESELYKQIKQEKKYELHAHLSGSNASDALEQMAGGPDTPLFKEYFVEKEKMASGLVPYEKCFSYFTVVERILGVDKPAATREEMERVRQNIILMTLSACEQYASDNVKYLELRTSLKRILAGGNFEPYVEAVLEGIRQAEEKFDVKVFLILSVRRRTSEADCQETLSLARKYRYEKGVKDPLKKVVGLDLSGSSVEGDGVDAIKMLKEAKDYFPILIHTGETSQEVPEKQATELNELRPYRVGHTPNVHNRKLLGKAVRELCPSSFELANMSEVGVESPCIKELKKKKFKVTIGCDDIAMFPDAANSARGNLCLTDEWYRVAKATNFTFEQLAKSQKRSRRLTCKRFIDRGYAQREKYRSLV